MQKVSVHGVRLLRAGLHWDSLLLTVPDHLHPSRKLLPEPLVPPGCDDLHIGLQGRRRQLKPDLVIPLARGAVGQRLRFFLPGDFHHSLGDERPCDGGPEEILALVDRSGPHHGKDKVPGELLLEVIDVHFAGPGPPRLGVEPVEFLLLADVGAKGDHFGVIGFLEPGEQHGGVESPGIGEHDLHGNLDGAVIRWWIRRLWVGACGRNP